jgi:hypothetical protein
VSAGGGDAKGASAGVRTRARINKVGRRGGVAEGKRAKGRRRGSPNKPAGASRVRGGAAVGSPAGRLRKAAKDGEGEDNRSPKIPQRQKKMVWCGHVAPCSGRCAGSRQPGHARGSFFVRA